MTQLLGLTPQTQKRGPLVVYPTGMGRRPGAAARVVLAAGLAAELVPALVAAEAAAAVVFAVRGRLFSQELNNDPGKVDIATPLNFDTLLQRRIDAVKRVLPLLNPESKANVDLNFGPEFSGGLLSGETQSNRQLMEFQTVYDYWLNPMPSARPTRQQEAKARAAIRLVETPGLDIEGLILANLVSRAGNLLVDNAEAVR
jgi:hypothetical protein